MTITPRRSVYIALTVVVGFFAVGWIGQKIYLAEVAEPRIAEDRALAAAHVDEWLEDATRIAAHPFFVEVRPDKDAGPFLNVRLPWEGLDDEPRPLALPEPAVALLQGFPDVADASALTTLARGLDYGWMKEALAFGFWDISDPTVLKERLDKFPADDPLPSFIAYRDWARLRLWSGHEDGTLDEAMKEVRHLAWLAYTTETGLGGLIAVAMLADAESIAKRGNAEAPIYFSKEERDRLRRVLRFARGFLATHLDKETIARALSAPEVVRCGSQNVYGAALGGVMGPSAHAFPEQTALLRNAIEQPSSRCRLTWARRSIRVGDTVGSPNFVVFVFAGALGVLGPNGETPRWLELVKLVPGLDVTTARSVLPGYQQVGYFVGQFVEARAEETASPSSP